MRFSLILISSFLYFKIIAQTTISNTYFPSIGSSLITARATMRRLMALFSPASLLPTPPLKNYDTSVVNYDPEVPDGQTWVNTQDNSLANARRKASLKAWWTGLMLNQEPSILEKMVLFWHNHFPIDADDRSVIMAYIYCKTLRQLALGNFKTLVKAITLDPMMLRYLNGALSNVIAPDEN